MTRKKKFHFISTTLSLSHHILSLSLFAASSCLLLLSLSLTEIEESLNNDLIADESSNILPDSEVIPLNPEIEAFASLLFVCLYVCSLFSFVLCFSTPLLVRYRIIYLL